MLTIFYNPNAKVRSKITISKGLDPYAYLFSKMNVYQIAL